MIYAHCDRKGVITFSKYADLPGLIQLGGGKMPFRKAVEVRARHGYDGTYLVPGVPEAANEADALNAVFFFRDWLAGGDAKKLAKKYDTMGIQDRALKAAFS